MKIYIDINHPAHVHYFRNFIKIMEGKGHNFVVSNRDSKIINELLDNYQIEHLIRNKRPTKKSLFHTMIYLLGIIGFILRNSIKKKPDVYVGFASSPCAIAAFLLRKPSILLDDTEHNTVNHALYKPFCSALLTPFYFKKHLLARQEYFQAYIEQLYLHSSYFKANTEVIRELGLDNEPYALVRYIAYDARHDSEVQPLSNAFKKELVTELAKRMRVIVSSESDTIDSFYTPYQLRFSPEKMHDVIAHASYFLTEGATMASEACILGVPYLYINPLQELGYILEQVKSYPAIAKQSANETRVLELLLESIDHLPNEQERSEIAKSLENSTINPTQYLVEYVEAFWLKKVSRR